MNEAKVFGVIALKGGVGKTSVSANLGAAIASEFNKKVLIVDANFNTPHLGLHLGIVNPKFSLNAALNNQYSIFEAIYQHPLGFHVIPGSIAQKQTNHLVLKEKLEPLKKIYDYIIIDSSPSLNDEMYATMAASDDLIVVSSPDFPTLSATLQAIKIAKKKDAPIKGIVINKIRKKRFELSSKDISKASGVDVLASIPDDVSVLAALSEMQPIIAFKPMNEVSIAFKKLAGSLIGERYKAPKLFARAKHAIKNL